MEDFTITQLSEEIDNQILKWLVAYKAPALNLTAIILARLTWLAKQSDCMDDFLRLLESPKELMLDETNKPPVH